MRRAAVCIGVNKTGGGLTPLNVAAESAERMAEWARTHGFDEVHAITDAQQPVTADMIRQKITALVTPGNLTQLVVYFSGHGINKGGAEYWLLSGAPVDDSQAVNLDGAKLRAHQSGVPHVVFISDACRTAAEGVQMQLVEGNTVFPNLGAGGKQKKVDVFYACTLGSPAHEIKDAAERYTAIYTEELLAALNGTYPEALVKDGDEPGVVVRPRPLAGILEPKVTARLTQRFGFTPPVSQTPDAMITSNDDAWLARFPEAPVPELAEFSLDDDEFEVHALPVEPQLSEAAKRRAAVRDAIAAGPKREPRPERSAGLDLSCGFVIRGEAVREAIARHAGTVARGDTVEVDVSNDPADHVLLELGDGRGVVLPALRRFIATLTFEKGYLKNVAYEPSPTHPGYQMYDAQREELTEIRNVIAAAADIGGFRLDPEDAPQLTERIRDMKGLDPTMAIYAAYSYHALGEQDLIREMQQYLRDGIQVTLFDVALLAGTLGEQPAYPFVPMLAQGWALLQPLGVRLPGRLAELKGHVGPSLWTTFDEEGVRILREELKG